MRVAESAPTVEIVRFHDQGFHGGISVGSVRIGIISRGWRRCGQPVVGEQTPGREVLGLQGQQRRRWRVGYPWT